jgi:hypothetical protein
VIVIIRGISAIIFRRLQLTPAVLLEGKSSLFYGGCEITQGIFVIIYLMMLHQVGQFGYLILLTLLIISSHLLALQIGLMMSGKRKDHNSI